MMSETVCVTGTSKRSCFVVSAFKYSDIILSFVADTKELAEIEIQRILDSSDDGGLHAKPASREDFHINEIVLIGLEIL